MAKKESKYIWKDRKRYFGLPLSFTRYALSEDRLFLSVGCFTIRDDEMLLYRVRDIITRRSLWQRICGVGTVTIISSDKSQPNLVLKNIRQPLQFKELLHTHVEEMKERRRMRVGEILASSYDEGEIDNEDLEME
jgi:uncharacterized membrane protein YdbT with pleckstrin-like domain